MTSTIRYGDGKNNGHSLGDAIVSLQQVTATTVDLELSSLIPAVTTDVKAVRASLLAGAAGSSIDTVQLAADMDRVISYCSAALDPLS